MICSAKALGSGMPISALIARDSVMTWPPGAHGSTFGGNPVCCAAALATLDVIEGERLVENAARVGNRLLRQLRRLAESSELIGDVRGLGLMIGIELVRDKETKEPAKAETDALMMACFRRGLLTLPCGPNSLRLSPPLTLTEGQADAAMAILSDALEEIEGRRT